MERQVKQERSHWRDAAISARHRLYGYDVPMTDIDFLAVEYSRKRAVMLVDYKAARPFPVNPQAANYTVLSQLASASGVPFVIVFYSPRLWWFYIHPMNSEAAAQFGRGVWMSEREYVSALYDLRGLPIPSQIAAQLSDFKP